MTLPFWLYFSTSFVISPSSVALVFFKLLPTDFSKNKLSAFSSSCWLQNGAALKKMRHFICIYGSSLCFASNVPPPNVCPQGSVLWWAPQCWCLIFIPAPKHCHFSKDLGFLNASHFCFVFKICLYKAFQQKQTEYGNMKHLDTVDVFIWSFLFFGSVLLLENFPSSLYT